MMADPLTIAVLEMMRVAVWAKAPELRAISNTPIERKTPHGK
jgi:hypothetical protein